MNETNHELFLVSWNVTQRCNLHCKHCYIDASASSKTKKELSTEEGLRLIDQIAQVNSSAMLVLTGGEPLLRKDVFQLAEYAAKKGLMVVLGTNATLINEAIAEKLKACGVKGVGISLDSTDAKKHDSFRGMQGAWESTMRGIEAVKKARIEFQIQATATKENYDEIPDIIDLAHSLGAKVF